MGSRALSGLLLTALAALPSTAGADEPRGRAGTWDLEANIGLSVLDTGFDRRLMGYTLNTPPNGSSKVPETQPDHLTTLVPEMRRRGAGRGLATMCIGVGQGIATAVEGAR